MCVPSGELLFFGLGTGEYNELARECPALWVPCWRVRGWRLTRPAAAPAACRCAARAGCPRSPPPRRRRSGRGAACHHWRVPGPVQGRRADRRPALLKLCRRGTGGGRSVQRGRRGRGAGALGILRFAGMRGVAAGGALLGTCGRRRRSVPTGAAAALPPCPQGLVELTDRLSIQKAIAMRVRCLAAAGCGGPALLLTPPQTASSAVPARPPVQLAYEPPAEKSKGGLAKLMSSKAAPQASG